MVSGRTCSPSSLEARCFVAAHDADSGTERWRTYTAAGADDPGGQTWGTLPTANRVHVSPWGVPGSFDPELNRVFWGVAVPLPYPRLVRRGTWDVGDSSPCELYSNSTIAMNADTGAIDWYYQYLPCDDWDQDFVQERTLIDTVVDPDPEAVRWINPKLTGTAEERKVVVVLGEPGGLFVNDRETGEFLWADPFPFESTERFVISDVDVETGTTYINMDLVAREEGDQFIICGHNVKGWWSWSYSPVTGMLYVPINRSCLNQTTNSRTISGASPRFTIPDPDIGPDGDLTEVRAIDISTGREVWRYSQRAPNAGTTLATAGNVVFFGDSNRRFRAFDAETGDVLWETILGSQISGYPVTYAVDRPAVHHRAGGRGRQPAADLRAGAGGAGRQQHAGDVRAAVDDASRPQRQATRTGPPGRLARCGRDRGAVVRPGDRGRCGRRIRCRDRRAPSGGDGTRRCGGGHRGGGAEAPHGQDAAALPDGRDVRCRATGGVIGSRGGPREHRDADSRDPRTAHAVGTPRYIRRGRGGRAGPAGRGQSACSGGRGAAGRGGSAT